MQWNDLTMAQKNELMQTYIRNGVTSLNQMRSHFNSFATGGPKKKIKSIEEILAEKEPLEQTIDNTYTAQPAITLQQKKDYSKMLEEQRKQEIQKQQAARTPILKADVVSEEDRKKYRNQAEKDAIINNANEAAANFGYSIGANHPMTINEVNSNTLGALETAGWMIAPELMGLGATGYYMATDRPEEAAITAALSLGPGIIRGIKGATNTRLLKQEVKEMDKALELWKGNNSTPLNEAHVIHSPYNNYKSVSSTNALDYNTAQRIQSFVDARNKFAQKHNLPIVGYNYNQPLKELYNEGKQVIKDANAFYRGVNFWKEAAEGVGILDEKAFKEYAATHPWEGARDVWITPKKEYARLYGDPIRVVRPYELGKNPINWFNEGDFDFKLADGLRTPNATEGIYMPWREEPKEWWRWHTSDEPYIKSFNPREEAELLYIGDRPLTLYNVPQNAKSLGTAINQQPKIYYTKDNPFKDDSFDIKNLFSNMIGQDYYAQIFDNASPRLYLNKIEKGKDFREIPISQKSREIFEKQVFPRLFADPERVEMFDLLYGSEASKELVKKQIVEDLYSQKQYITKPRIYEAVESVSGKASGTTAGMHYPEKGTLLKDTNKPLDDILDYAEGHELRHELQDIVPRTSTEEKILQDAYSDVPNPYSYDYDMSREWETMNFDARKALGNMYPHIFNQEVEIQNKVIDKIKDEDFIKIIENSDNYWQEYIKHLREQGVDLKSKIPAWKEAMKKVGMIATPVAIGASISKSED